MAHLAALRGGKFGDDGRGIDKYSLIVNSIQFNSAPLFCSSAAQSEWARGLYSTLLKLEVAAAAELMQWLLDLVGPCSFDVRRTLSPIILA